jgi:ring-1,2-phenylacetyl-CoA epoxidase subunit PaaE
MLDFIKNYFQGFASLFFLFLLVYVLIWVLLGKKLANRKIQLSKRAGWAQIKSEIIASLIASLGSTLFSMYVYSLKDQGLTQFYTEIGKYGMWYEFMVVGIMIFLSDTWFYWFHRGMHQRSVYKYVHALHHKSLDVNPFTSNSFHMIESIMLTVWILPLVIFLPISPFSLGIVQALGMFNNLKSHLGYELFPGFFSKAPFHFLVTATNHSLHHTQYNGNYGLYFRFWDILCDTELNTTEKVFKDIHARKNAEVIDNTYYRPLVISKLIKETSDSVSVYFEPTDKAFYTYLPGQYLSIKVKIGNKTYERCFSISSNPDLDAFLRITVKLNGEVSHYFYETAVVGDRIDALLPVGDFSIDLTKNDYLFVAGGSGITPLYSMIRTLLAKKPNANISLLYASKDAGQVIFGEELRDLKKKHANFELKEFYSRKSRMGIDDFRDYLNYTAYICGPDGLKDSVKKYLKTLGFKSSQINMEHYADGYTPWFGIF